MKKRKSVICFKTKNGSHVHVVFSFFWFTNRKQENQIQKRSSFSLQIPFFPFLFQDRQNCGQTGSRSEVCDVLDYKVIVKR